MICIIASSYIHQLIEASVGVRTYLLYLAMQAATVPTDIEQ